MPNGSGRPSNFAPEGGGMRDGRARSTAAPFTRWRLTTAPLPRPAHRSYLPPSDATLAARINHPPLVPSPGMPQETALRA